MIYKYKSFSKLFEFKILVTNISLELREVFFIKIIEKSQKNNTLAVIFTHKG